MHFSPIALSERRLQRGLAGPIYDKVKTVWPSTNTQNFDNNVILACAVISRLLIQLSLGFVNGFLVGGFDIDLLERLSVSTGKINTMPAEHQSLYGGK